ncbi:hypothetical protein BOX15_Mlig013360g1, partial [Macrostomum lignano]
LGATEILDARQYWSDDENWHAKSQHRRPVRQSRTLGQSDAARRPITVTALKARIRRQRRIRQATADEAATSEEESAGEFPAIRRKKFTRPSRSEIAGQQTQLAANNGFHNGNAIVYPSSTNPDVFYRTAAIQITPGLTVGREVGVKPAGCTRNSRRGAQNWETFQLSRLLDRVDG